MLLRAFAVLGASVELLHPGVVAASPESPAARRPPPEPSPLPEFSRLWEGVFAHRLPAARLLCQFGLSNTTAEVLYYLLEGTRHSVAAVEVFDIVAGAAGASAEATLLFHQLEAMLGGRIFTADAAQSLVSEEPPCDVVVFSEAAPTFSIERLLPRLGDKAVIALVSHTCIVDEAWIPTPACNHVNTIWEKSALQHAGYCLGPVCIASVASGSLQDPHTLPLDCPAFVAGESGANASLSEFGQDWFLFWNFFRSRPGGGRGLVYVDVGASLPYEYSNTVVFDRCLGWSGLCIEPNPYVTHLLRAHRSCKVIRRCVSDNASEHQPFYGRDGDFFFASECLPLGELLGREGFRGHRIDVLSIDIEHGELRALSGLPLEEFDIRFLVIEVTKGVRWLEVDSVLLPRGYAKIVVLGRDVVYAKLDELSVAGAASLPVFSRQVVRMPGDWAEFHQRVLDEELEAEAEYESWAFEQGLRPPLMT